jgi:hypothetical protein
MTKQATANLAALAATLFLFGCSGQSLAPRNADDSTALNFGPERRLGDSERNPGTPFLRYAPDGRLYAIWTEDDEKPWPDRPGEHQHGGKMALSPMRNALLAWSSDGGKTWSTSKRINSDTEAVQGEENGPKIAFSRDKRAHIVWSIPGAKGDKTRANIRFAMEDDKGGFTAARTLNEVEDAARFPIIELTPDGNLLIAWIDRRLDQPHPRQLYLMRMNPDGQAVTKNYQVGAGLCECCKLGISFADGGKTVYMVDREVDGNKIRNHVLRKSTDGGATFAKPVEISNDGWQVPSCPHSGPSIGQDSRGHLHVSWFTQGRSESEAGIYYSVSTNGGKSFAPRSLIDRNRAPETLYNSLVIGDDDTAYFVWSNIDSNERAQIYLRTLAPDRRTWSPIQQLSNATGNGSRPVLALLRNELSVAWTETDDEESRVVLRSATVQR